MEILKSLSEGQIRALSPECLKIILASGSKPTVAEFAKMSEQQINTLVDKDQILEQIRGYMYKIHIGELKRCVELYNKGHFLFDFTDYRQIKSILTKYTTNKFYFTYKATYGYTRDIIHTTSNWKVYDEDEFKAMLPIGVDISDLCYSKGHKPFKFLEYPDNYKKINDTHSNIKLEQLSYSHSNVFYVHPTMFNTAKHFFH
jgi:hypothetical protein